MRKSIILFLLIGVLLFQGIYSCKRIKKDEDPITIALNIWPGYGAFFIAKDMGYYKEEGVEVELRIIQGDPEREAALIAGKIDGIGMTIDNLVLLRDKGLSIKAIFKYDNSYGADGVVAKKDIETAADLKGKKVAYAPGTTSHYFLIQVLKDFGLSTKDLEHVAMSSDDAGAAFAAGRLDAAVTWEPWLTKAKEMPEGKILISTKEKPVVEDVLFMREDVLEKRAKDVKKMLRACFKAIEYWKENAEEGNKIIAKNLELPLSDVEGMLSGIQIMDYEDNKKFFGIEVSHGPVYKAYKDANEAWIKEGIIEKGQDSKEGIDSTFISELYK